MAGEPTVERGCVASQCGSHEGRPNGELEMVAPRADGFMGEEEGECWYGEEVVTVRCGESTSRIAGGSSSSEEAKEGDGGGGWAKVNEPGRTTLGVGIGEALLAADVEGPAWPRRVPPIRFASELPLVRSEEDLELVVLEAVQGRQLKGSTMSHLKTNLPRRRRTRSSRPRQPP